MVQTIDKLALSKTLGRHTKLSVPFSWSIGGTAVDLEAESYSVRVWVQDTDGTTISGPTDATVSGTEATYDMNTDDLASPSETSDDTVILVAVAENVTNTLVSDGRAIVVGDWGGADNYTPS